MADSGAGRLFLCATPIGNLEDVSLRLLRVLGEVDLIAAEDTRQTRKLLSRYDLHKPMTSYHRHSSEERGAGIIAQIQAGKDVALVSDAGMPGISDPGEELVRDAIEAGICVVPVPGPVAAITALAASGLPTGRFCFEGFLPRHKRLRRQALARLAGEERTLVFYESPHHIEETLRDLLRELGDRRVVMARELTKVHEEFWRGTMAGALERVCEGARGEYTLVVGGVSPEERAAEAGPSPDSVDEQVESLCRGEGITEMEALKRLARKAGRPKSELYRQLIDERAKRNGGR